jgi:hypothetical protein
MWPKADHATSATQDTIPAELKALDGNWWMDFYA